MKIGDRRRRAVGQRRDRLRPIGAVIFGVAAALPLICQSKKNIGPIRGKLRIILKPLQGIGRGRIRRPKSC